VPDTGVIEEVDRELASNTKSEESEIVEVGLADALGVILFLLILTKLASESFEVAVFISVGNDQWNEQETVGGGERETRTHTHTREHRDSRSCAAERSSVFPHFFPFVTRQQMWVAYHPRDAACSP
jgi:hypothetical protein